MDKRFHALYGFRGFFSTVTLRLTVLGVLLLMMLQPVLAQEGSVPATPARPTTDSVTHDSVSLSWADPEDSSITGYQILRRDPAIHDRHEFLVIEDDTGSSDTSYEDTGVEPETRYIYRVKARNSHGLSSWSKVAKASTLVEPTPTNESPSGLPTITGMAQVGETLSADTSAISDGNGLTNTQYGYQWVRTSGGTDADIAGATGQTYTLTSDDQGSTVKVRVSFTDDDGYSETLTSAATDAVVTLIQVDVQSGSPAYQLQQQPQQAPAQSTSEPAGQDLAEDNTTTGWVIVGAQGARGNLGTASDVDAFKINLEAQKRYRIDVVGDGPRDFARGGTYAGDVELMVRTLQDTVDTSFERVNGFGTETPGNTTINNVVNIGSGPDEGARSEFDVMTTGTYLVKIVSDGSNTGTYTVRASEITSEQAFGDFTSQWNSGRIKIDDTAAMTGALSDASDSDWYMATFEAGKCYSIQVKGQHSNQEHNGGTLSDPKVKVMNFYDYYHARLYDPNTLAYIGVPADEQDVAYFDETYINPSTFELLNRAEKFCNVVRPSDQSDSYKLVCNYYCDDDSGPGNNSLIKVRVSTGGEGDYVIGVEGQGSTGTYSVFIKEITCPSN